MRGKKSSLIDILKINDACFFYFSALPHTPVCSFKTRYVSPPGSNFSLEFFTALFVLVTLVIIISAEALMNDLFKVRYASTRRMCALPALCPLALLVLLSKVDACEGVTEFFFLLFKREKPCCCYCCSVYIWSCCWGISKDAQHHFSHWICARRIEKQRPAVIFLRLPLFTCAHRCGTFLITLCGPRSSPCEKNENAILGSPFSMEKSPQQEYKFLYKKCVPPKLCICVCGLSYFRGCNPAQWVVIHG